MELSQILVLALVQGITEFLPISSSAHLILAPLLLGYADQGLAFDVSVHVGTLAAVVLYFRRELATMTRDLLRSATGRAPATPDSRLAWMIVFATVPVVIAGLLMKGLVETELRSPLVIAATTIGFGVLLWVFDRRGRRVRDEYSVGWRDALVVGLAQAVALIPGTSRSGITITAGLALGLTREAASRFSFLLSIPTILMSGGLVTLDLIRATTPVNWTELSIGAFLAFVTAYACIHYFLKFIERISMLPFVLYRFALGIVILIAVL